MIQDILKQVYRDDSLEINVDLKELNQANLLLDVDVDDNQISEIDMNIPTFDVFPKWIEGVDTTYAPYLPTSYRIMTKALQLANCSGSSENLLDLGSGDGRFCTAAVCGLGFGCAIGIETDEGLVARAEALRNITLLRSFQQTVAEDRGVDQDLLKKDLQEQRRRCEFLRDEVTPERVRQVVHDKKITCITVFLTKQFADEHSDLLIDCFNQGITIICILFSLSQIKELIPLVSDTVEGIYIYKKKKSH